MPVQAYVDDSKADGEVLVLAGYLASFERWEKFSMEWRALLGSMQPPWEAFKMADIAGGGGDRKLRAGCFYRLVEDTASAFVAVAVELEPLQRVVRELGFPKRRFANPYNFAFRAIMDATVQYQRSLGIDEPVDFIFDARKEENFVRAGWEVFRDTARPEFRHLIGRKPRFERDNEFLPLQAADMLAWHARDHWLKHRSITKGENLVLSWKPLNNPAGYRFNFGYAELLEIFKEMRERAVEVGLVEPMSTISVRFSCDLSGPKPRF